MDPWCRVLDSSMHQVQAIDEESVPSPKAPVPSPPVNAGGDGLGSVYVGGMRRSARYQPLLGSVTVGGKRRSARLMKT